MILKKILPLFLIVFTSIVMAQEQADKFKLYGFVGNDFFFNSRQNVESTDGLILLFPKPINIIAGVDKNAIPQAEMLSINTRLGLDINGSPVFGAKSTAKIEADFSGFGASFYVLRIRQAYVKLNWDKTELLLGQTWHPMFGSVMPTTISMNGGAPFQPFNRSPQIRLKRNLSTSLSLTAAALYQMQYTSQGPIGSSNSYLKNAMIPDLFLGMEAKTKHWTSGIGGDLKTINPVFKQHITSVSAVAYTQYVKPGFQLKAKAVWGENLSDHLMLGGYGVSKLSSDSTTAIGFTNYNTLSSWLNAIYGTKLQVAILLGISQNLGTNKELVTNKSNKFTAYGCGFDTTTTSQLQIDRLIRISPSVSYNLPNMKFGVEYDLTSAVYGTLQSNGRVIKPYNINNHRVLASVCYIF